jgi:glycosyltransferase involved in cell wall biosynthesis
MKFSIITVLFNAENTIRQTLESILVQKNVNLELIIIDGNSSDNSRQIIGEFSSHISHFVSEPDQGIYDAMNKGLSLATGDIIGILNADDFYCRPDVLERVQQIFISKPGIDGVYSDLVYVEQYKPTIFIRHWKAGPFNPKNFYWGWMPPHPTVFLKREVYQSVGNFSLQFRSAADYEFLLRACLKFGKKLHYLPGVVVHMRAGGLSNASLKNRLKANAEDRLAWKINGLNGGFLASILKPIRKIIQFLDK